MNKLIEKIRHPLRSLDHVSIKFFGKKVKWLPAIEVYFKQKIGLEIGGPSRIFSDNGYIPIYSLTKSVDGVNFSTSTVWENTISEGNTYDFGGSCKGRQFIQDGTDLSIIASDSYDFILSSHSLEHIANPLKALKEWLRVLKKGGALMLILPDSRYTFDCKRPFTKFEHLLTDFKNNISEHDLTHLEEIIALHDLSYDDGVSGLDEFKKRSFNNFENRCLHHHIFNLQLLRQILVYNDMTILHEEAAPPFNLIMMAIK